MFRLQFQTFCFLALLGRVRSFEFSHGLITLPKYNLDVNEDTKIVMDDIVCHNLTVGDVDIRSLGNSSNVQISAEIQAIGLVCRMDLALEWNGIQADAQAYFETNNTDVTSQMRLEDDLLLVDECFTAMRLKEMEITGLSGLMAIFVDSIIEKLMETMESALGDAICDEFRKAIPNMLGDNVKEVSTVLTNLAEANSRPWIPSVRTNADNPPLIRLDKNESSIEMIMHFAWIFSSFFLNSAQEDGTLVANSIARRLFLNSSDAYKMDDLEYTFDFENSTLASWGIESLDITGGSVRGLDSIAQFDDIRPTGPTSLQTSIVLQELQITLDATLYTNETVIVNGTIVNSTLIADNFQVDLSLSNVFATIDVNLELMASYLEDIQIGALLTSPDIASCLMGAVQNVSIANVRFEKLDYRAPIVRNLDPLLEKLFTGSVGILMVNYFDILPDVIGHLVSNAVVQAQPPFEGAVNAVCDFSSGIGSNATHLDFRDLLLSPERATVAGASGDTPYGSRAYIVKDYINKNLLAVNPETDRPYLNEKAPATTRQSGTPGTFTFAERKSMFEYKDSIVVGTSTVPIRLDVRRLTIENLNHWLSPMMILQPIFGEPSGLDNLVQFGIDDDPSLQISTVVALTVGDDFSSDFLINVEIKSLSLLIDILLNVREDPFLLYRLGDIKDGHCLASLLETDGIDEEGRSEAGVPPFDLSAFDMQLKGVKMDVQCHRCRDGMTETLVEVVSGVVRSIFSDGLYLHMGYNQLAEKDEQRNVVSELLNTIERRSRLFEDFLDKLIADSPKNCKRSPEYDPESKSPVAGLLQSFGFKPRAVSPRSEAKGSGSSWVLITLIDLIGILICAWILARAYLKYKVRRRHREWLSSLPPSRVIAIYERQEKAKNHDLMMNRCCPTIFHCEQTPRYRKLFAIIALMITIVLFLNGISNTAAVITTDLYINNSLAYSFSVDYSLMTIVELTWESDGYLMAIATAFAVGIWPMVRQFMTLFLLFIPSNYLDIKRRGRILLLLDHLGKWSMLVVILSMLNVAAFSTSVQSPPGYLLPFKVQLMYVPHWGTYSTFLAQLISYNLAYVILEFHKLSVAAVEAKIRGPGSLPTEEGDEDFSSTRQEESTEDTEQQIASTDGEKKQEIFDGRLTCLSDTQFAKIIPYCDKLWTVRPLAQKLFFMTACCIAVPLLFAGSITTSYTSKLEGILNDLLEMKDVSVEMTNDHSVFSVMGALLNQATTLNQPLHYFGHGLMLWFLFLSVFVAPVMVIAFLLVQWFVPLTSSTRRKLDVLIRCVFSWQATEVYIIATIIGAWQMDDLASYMTSSLCYAFDPLLDFLAQYGWISHSQCFGVHGDVGGGALALCLGCALLYMMLIFVSSARKQTKRQEDFLALVVATAADNGKPSDAKRAKELIDDIDLFPVIFTDRFSWLLQEAI